MSKRDPSRLPSISDMFLARELADRDGPRPPEFPPTPPPPLMSDMSDDEVNSPIYPPHVDAFPYTQGVYLPPPPPFKPWSSMPEPAPWVPTFAAPDIRIKDVWKPSNAYSQAPSSYIGAEILNALRYKRGGIVYMKRDGFRQYLYVDEVPFYKLNLVPLSLIPANEPEFSVTEIGKGWVRQEALDLLCYSYNETPSGHFSISRDLDFVSEIISWTELAARLTDVLGKFEIEELVRISYQALWRGLEERSRQVIKERGWHENVVALNQEMQRTRYPSRPPSYPEPWSSRRRQPYARYPGEHTIHRSRSRERYRPSTSTLPKSRANVGSLQKVTPQNADSESHQPITTQRRPRDEGKSVAAAAPVSEVRFTLPRMEAVRHTQLELEIQEATEKLSLLQKRRDEAARNKDHTLKSDLEYYAIPEMEARIKELKQQLEPWVEDDQKKGGDEKRAAIASASTNTEAEKRQIRHNPGVQTYSESSSEEERDESEATDINKDDSDNDSATLDLYE